MKKCRFWLGFIMFTRLINEAYGMLHSLDYGKLVGNGDKENKNFDD